MVLPDQRPADGESAKARSHQQVDERLAVGRYARLPDPVAQLVTRERALVRQGSLDRRDAPLDGSGTHARLRETPRVPGGERRRRQRMEPPVVLPANEVQGPTVEPADHERALVRQRPVDVGGGKTARPRPDRDPGAAEILCLDGQQAVDHPHRIHGPLWTEKLRRESSGRDGRRLSCPLAHHPSRQ